MPVQRIETIDFSKIAEIHNLLELLKQYFQYKFENMNIYDENQVVPEKVKEKRNILLKMYNIGQILEELTTYFQDKPNHITVNSNLRFLGQLLEIFMMEIYVE